jgi:wobble nucleotide-excising tRNase
MLKRIKSIQNVGKFKLCKPAAVEFGKITFIYGLNTYGKSTLGDIFSSLRTGKTSAIKARKTIPGDDSKQEITLSFQPEGKSESNIVYSNDSWQSKLPADLNLHVFDDGFYHDNLFSSRQFTRATKEAFSSFVLGEKGGCKSSGNIREKQAKR